MLTKEQRTLPNLILKIIFPKGKNSLALLLRMMMIKDKQ